jgi:hypothetical protein
MRSLNEPRDAGRASGSRGISSILGTTGTSILGGGGGGGSGIGGALSGDAPGIIICAKVALRPPRVETIAQTNRTIISFWVMTDMS